MGQERNKRQGRIGCDGETKPASVDLSARPSIRQPRLRMLSEYAGHLKAMSC